MELRIIAGSVYRFGGGRCEKLLNPLTVATVQPSKEKHGLGNKILNLASIVISLFLFGFSFCVSGEDWPMWRYDASRSAVSPGELPRDLHLRWVRKLPPAQAAWPHVGRLHFDASYEPIAQIPYYLTAMVSVNSYRVRVKKY